MVGAEGEVKDGVLAGMLWVPSSALCFCLFLKAVCADWAQLFTVSSPPSSPSPMAS